MVVNASECEWEGRGFDSHYSHVGFFIATLTGSYLRLGMLLALFEGYDYTAEF